MRSKQRAALIVLVSLLVLTGAGLVVTTEWGAQTVAPGASQQKDPQSPVDLGQFRRAQALSQLAATPEEQDLARDVLRKADHEVDFAFASALYQASSQKIPSTPEIRDALDRIAKGEQEDAELTTDVARLTKQLEGTKESQKEALTQQLDLTKSRQELIEDELADAHQDLERAGGDPQSSVQRMVDEYNASEQSSGGQLDLSIVGKQASASLPASYSFISRARAWYALHSIVGRLDQEGRAATAGATTFSGRHDQLEHQLEEAQSKQSKKMKETPAGSAPGEKSAGAAPSASTQTSEAISSYKSLTALQKRLSALDNRIRNLQGLAADYAMWRASAATRRRDLTHSLLISVALMLLIGLAVLLTAYLLERMFTRVEPDQQRLLTLRSVLHIFTRAVGAILLLVIIFGVPTQLATVIALAGAGLTVAMKDFIVGFFGWFILMGKNGIRVTDWVEINGVGGEVIEVGFLHTVLLETGGWTEVGHPTGRRVSFVNSFAIEGHYFNFSTSGQWLWDEIEVQISDSSEPYAVAEAIQKIAGDETAANAKLAEAEWNRVTPSYRKRSFSATPSLSVRPTGSGVEVLVRYITRVDERHRVRARIYRAVVELLHGKQIPESAASPGKPGAAAASPEPVPNRA